MAQTQSAESGRPQCLLPPEVNRAAGLNDQDLDFAPPNWPAGTVLGWFGIVAIVVTLLSALLAAPRPLWMLLSLFSGALVSLVLGEKLVWIGVLATFGVWGWQIWLAVSESPYAILGWLGALAGSAVATWTTSGLWRRYMQRKLGLESLGRLLKEIKHYNADVQTYLALQELALAQDQAGEPQDWAATAQALRQQRSTLLRLLRMDRVWRQNRGLIGSRRAPRADRDSLEALAIDHRNSMACEQLRERLALSASRHAAVELVLRESGPVGDLARS